MAQPTGSCDLADFGYTVWKDYSTYDDNGEYLYFLLPLPKMPLHWQEDGTQDAYMPCDVVCAPYLDVAAGDEARIHWSHTSGAYALIQDYAGDIDGWQSEETFDRPTSHPCYRPPSFLGDDREQPQYAKLTVQVGRSDATDDVEVDGIYWEIAFDEDYDAPDPSGARKVELTNRDTAAKRLFTQYRALSSWFAMRVMCHSLNKLLSEARYTVSLPLFGGYPGA